MRLTALVPLIPPDDDEAEEWIERYRSFEREILALSGTIEVFRDLPIRRGSKALKFSCVQAGHGPSFPGEWKLLYRQWPSGRILRADVDFTLAEAIPGNDNPYMEDQIVVAAEIRSILTHLLLLANVGRPGVLQFGEGVVIQKGGWLVSTPRLLSDLIHAVDHVRTIGWPPVADLPLHDVLAWYPYESLHAATPQTGPLARAMNAVSYLFGSTGPESQVSAMLYSLIGLEALYTDTHDGIAEQINSKAQILIGPMNAFKKELKQMYHIRSRFLHGDLDFPRSFESIRPSDYPTLDAIDRSANLASMLLLVTLQRMCEHRLSELKFRLVHDTPG
jgi:hypothetical protein